MDVLDREDPAVMFTMGPNASDEETVQALIEAGATAARTSFSYATPDVHAERAALVRRAAGATDAECAVVADLPGEKARLGDFEIDRFELRAGETVTFATDGASGEGRFTVEPASFFDRVAEDDLLTVGDGAARLRVARVDERRFTAEAVVDGELNPSRGIVVQGGGFEPTSIRDAEREYLRFVANSGAFDAVALSFVSHPDDVREARAILGEAGPSLAIVAKIETPAGVENADSIAEVADAVMVARGDLALFLPWYELGRHVERTVEAADAAGTPWIMATQIAEGVGRFAFPTRAEICDLSRWYDEGMAGVLLSYETAFGPRPVDAVAAVARLLEE